ncbi:N-acetyltransferase [Citricoccus nitrophenolicus]
MFRNDQVILCTSHAYSGTPTSLVTAHFRLEPLGPQHNEADLDAWMSSVEQVRATPGYLDGNWPPPEGYSLEWNLKDLERHAVGFPARTGFTFTVLDPEDGDVIGCVYLYPPEAEGCDVTKQFWVRASQVHLDGPLADALVDWIAAEFSLPRCPNVDGTPTNSSYAVPVLVTA